MNAFIKQEGKLNGDLSIFAYFAINAVKKGRKKNAGTILVSIQDELTNTEMPHPAR